MSYSTLRKAKTKAKVKAKKVAIANLRASTFASFSLDSPSRQTPERRAARARLSAFLASPSMSPEAVRERIARGASWEDEHGAVSAFAGRRA